MGLLIDQNGKYSNKDVVENVVRYVVRERKNENRSDELVGWGVCGFTNNLSVEQLIHQMNATQKIYDIDKRGGRRIRHQYYRFSENDQRFLNVHPEIALRIADECAYIYFEAGFQVIYSVHLDTKWHFHIHFCINAINYTNGKKFSETIRTRYEREKMFDAITRKYITIEKPIIFSGEYSDTGYYDEFLDLYYE